MYYVTVDDPLGGVDMHEFRVRFPARSGCLRLILRMYSSLCIFMDFGRRNILVCGVSLFNYSFIDDDLNENETILNN